MQDLNNQRRRTSLRGSESETLKNLTSNLLPSLDASMDSLFSLTDKVDTNHDSITNHGSIKSAPTTSGFQSSATDSSSMFSDLDNSNKEDDMAASSRSTVSMRLKKVFSKVKRSSIMGRKSTITTDTDKKGSQNHNAIGKYFTTSDAGTESEDEEDLLPKQKLFCPETEASTDYEAESEKRQRRSTKSHRRTKSSEEEDVDDTDRPLRSKKTTKSRSSEHNTEAKSSRESRKSKSSGKRKPPRKSKSMDADVGALMVPRRERQTSKRSALQTHASDKRIGSTASARKSNITAKDSLSIPRGSLRDRQESHRQLAKSKSFCKSQREHKEKKDMRRSKSSREVTMKSKPEKEDVQNGKQKRPLQHAETYDGTAMGRTSSHKSLHKLGEPTQGKIRQRSTSRSRDDKKKGKSVLNAAAPAQLCRHNEILGECCYDVAKVPDRTTTLAKLNAFIDTLAHKEQKPITQGEDVSIDTMDTNAMINMGLKKTKSTDDYEGGNELVRRHAKLKSRSPSDRAGRSSLRSKSPSLRRRIRRSLSKDRERSLSPPRNTSSERKQRSSMQQRERSVSRTRNSSSECKQTTHIHHQRDRSLSRARNTSSERQQRNQRERSVGRARNTSSERKHRSSVHQRERSVSRTRDGACDREGRSNANQPTERERSQSRTRDNTSSRGRRSHANQAAERERSQSRLRHDLAPTGGPEKSRSNLSMHQRNLSKQGRRRSNSNTRKEAPRKYATLSKEDLGIGNPDARSQSHRRPRSLSRTRLSMEQNDSAGQKPVHSRSLSRTNGSKSRPGIGNYLASKQPEHKDADDESNSQTTGTNTTGSHEITYVTPSWMWTKGNASANIGSLHASASSKALDASFQTAMTSVSIDDSYKSEEHTSWQDSFKSATSEHTLVTGSKNEKDSLRKGSNHSSSSHGRSSSGHSSNNGLSYDGSCEHSSSAFHSVASSLASKCEQSSSTFHSIATSLTQKSAVTQNGSALIPSDSIAKKFSGKMRQLEQDDIRTKSQNLFQNVTSVAGGNTSRSNLR